MPDNKDPEPRFLLWSRFTVPSALEHTERQFAWIVVDDAAAHQVALQPEINQTELIAAQYRLILGIVET